MKSKKGALELSMNTIVIIVIGVTLLILGLGFVTGIFDKLTQQRENIFMNLDTKISGIASHDEKLTVPSIITVEQGKTVNTDIYIVNYDNQEETFKVIVTPSDDPEFRNDKLITSVSKESIIKEGGEGNFGFAVKAPNDISLRSAMYTITAYANGKEYARDSVLIEVKK